MASPVSVPAAAVGASGGSAVPVSPATVSAAGAGAPAAVSPGAPASAAGAAAIDPAASASAAAAGDSRSASAAGSSATRAGVPTLGASAAASSGSDGARMTVSDERRRAPSGRIRVSVTTRGRFEGAMSKSATNLPAPSARVSAITSASTPT